MTNQATPITISVEMTIPTADIARAQSIKKKYEKCLPEILDTIPLHVLEQLQKKIEANPEIKNHIRNGTVPDAELIAELTGFNATVIKGVMGLAKAADATGTLFKSKK